MKFRQSIGRVLLAAVVVTGSGFLATPASASTSAPASVTGTSAMSAPKVVPTARLANKASCSSLYLTGTWTNEFIVGSCRPANARAGARIKLSVTCNYLWPFRNHVYVTLHHGGSFRVRSGCYNLGAWDLSYSRTWVG
jgi:hypothetical protein